MDNRARPLLRTVKEPVETNKDYDVEPTPITVVVVEDHDGFRTGLRVLLDRPGIEVVADAADGRAAVDAVVRLRPDVVLMDLDVPLLSGIEATRQIAKLVPTTRVLVLTVSGRDEDVVDAMVAGASGYLLKGTSAERLVAGIRAAASGESILSGGLAAKLLARAPNRHDSESAESSGASALSEREREILTLIARGKHNAEIAEELFLSPHTVRNHISNILAKLQIANRMEATAFAIRAGLV